MGGKPRQSLGQCQALTPTGGRCSETIAKFVRYFGNKHFYSPSFRPEPDWVLVGLCDGHSDTYYQCDNPHIPIR